MGVRRLAPFDTPGGAYHERGIFRGFSLQLEEFEEITAFSLFYAIHTRFDCGAHPHTYLR